ncbi:unnamed protein product [Oikopleura dioica]|uniref:Uncharacterized protein n=1 Tax=Oikopleura dioica TaxID=34765 RepID=E4XLC5_OIKDI|nr:unnamed protein product [Oikopleura dioica]
MNKLTTLAIQPASIYIAGEFIRRIEDEQMTGLQGKVKLTVERGTEEVKDFIDMKVRLKRRDNVQNTLNERKQFMKDNVLLNISSKEQRCRERTEIIEEKLETHNVKVECGLEDSYLGQDTLTAVKNEMDKISEECKNSFMDGSSIA